MFKETKDNYGTSCAHWFTQMDGSFKVWHNCAQGTPLLWHIISVKWEDGSFVCGWPCVMFVMVRYATLKPTESYTQHCVPHAYIWKHLMLPNVCKWYILLVLGRHTLHNLHIGFFVRKLWVLDLLGKLLSICLEQYKANKFSITLQC